jgi:hypothetical protein
MAGQEMFLISAVSRLTVGAIQPRIQRILGVHSLGIKHPRHEANHSPVSAAEVKNV